MHTCTLARMFTCIHACMQAREKAAAARRSTLRLASTHKRLLLAAPGGPERYLRTMQSHIFYPYDITHLYDMLVD